MHLGNFEIRTVGLMGKKEITLRISRKASEPNRRTSLALTSEGGREFEELAGNSSQRSPSKLSSSLSRQFISRNSSFY